MSNGIETSIESGVLVVTFARPEIRSPLSVAVLGELEKIIANCSADRSIHAVIFTGKNDVFASGADLREIAELTVETAPMFAHRGQNLMLAIADLTQTTIAAVNGFCFGGALDLAVACDMRIASPNAKFAHPGAVLGIITGWSGTQRLPRLIGQTNALEMFFTAAAIDATRALHFGLIDEIAENCLQRALELAG